MLRIVRTNEYGSHQYVEDAVNGTVPLHTLGSDDYWSIRDPSPELVAAKIGFHRAFNGCFFVLSQKALTVSPRAESFGAVVALSFLHPDTKVEYYLLTSDIKSYWMNCGGGSEAGETAEETAVREVQEELHIDLSHNHLDFVKEVDVKYHNALVDMDWCGTTFMFYSIVSFSQVQHLFHEQALDPYADFIVVDALPSLDETERILCVRGDRLEDVPLIIEGKTFSGDHRDVLREIERGACFA
jgi:8-oxo-dGTP pyrophosphatase MutT (NUDIX family)